mmetsp:Transcript_29860/g.86958  ORF Transcript_29860/g.86958 Transcript_29860/m.86958 type:complete len:206 (+) Transcript_29860:328-945(+)
MLRYIHVQTKPARGCRAVEPPRLAEVAGMGLAPGEHGTGFPRWDCQLPGTHGAGVIGWQRLQPPVSPIHDLGVFGHTSRETSPWEVRLHRRGALWAACANATRSRAPFGQRLGQHATSGELSAEVAEELGRCPTARRSGDLPCDESESLFCEIQKSVGDGHTPQLVCQRSRLPSMFVAREGLPGVLRDGPELGAMSDGEEKAFRV